MLDVRFQPYQTMNISLLWSKVKTATKIVCFTHFRTALISAEAKAKANNNKWGCNECDFILQPENPTLPPLVQNMDITFHTQGWSWYQQKETLSERSTFLLVPLAASTQSMCTASVCSCYAPSRDFNKEGEESSRSNHNSLGAPSEKKDWGKEEVPYNELHGRENSNGHMEQHSLKSNLKKTTEPEDNNQFKTEKRKVCWPDAHGKDIAHVHEFEPSMSEEGELEEVRNSCICAIQ